MKSPSLDDQLCFALYAATNAVTRAFRPRLDRLGITYPQYLVMLVLWQDGKCALGAIARRLGLAPNAVTPLVDRLEAAGLARRSREGDDRRVIHIDLTEEGRALESQVLQAQDQVACEVGLAPAELEALRGMLKSLVRRMEPGTRRPPVSSEGADG